MNNYAELNILKNKTNFLWILNDNKAINPLLKAYKLILKGKESLKVASRSRSRSNLDFCENI